MKKTFKSLFGLALLGGMVLASCSGPVLPTRSSSSEAPSSAQQSEIEKIYNLYLANGGDLSYDEWLKTIKGEPGKDGTSLRSGNGAPASTLGNDGDSYIDLETWDYYVKANGSWTKSGNMKGAQGEKGDKGDTGNPGSQGDKGDSGKSAYQIYIEAHPEYQGDEEQWLDDLVNGRLGDQEVFTVTFDLGYESKTFTQQVKKGEKATKPEDPERNGYKFLDWIDENDDHWIFSGFSITSDITLYAVWSDPIDYTVTFVNNDGSILDTQTAHYGDTASYQGETPVAANQDPHYIYTFAGWDKELVVMGDVTFAAQYTTAYIATTAYYYDEDGETLLATVPLAEGEEPHYTGETPTKARDKEKKLQFEFSGWDKTEETADAIKFVVTFASCTDGLDIEGNTVVYYHGSSADVEIPSVWSGQKITAIKEKAFDGNTILETIQLPNGLLSIGGYSFRGCTSLAAIGMPDSVSFIGDRAFEGCSSLVSANIPNSISSIKDFTFYYCSSLLSVKIPDSVTSIGWFAFCGCSSLASVNIPSSVTSIGTCAFTYCSSLSFVIIPNSVVTIDDDAFSDCRSLVVCCEANYKPANWSGSWCYSNDSVIWGEKDIKETDEFWYAVSSEDDELFASIIGFKEEVIVVTIPNEIDGMKVRLIAASLNKTRDTVTEISFEDSVVIVGDLVLENFKKLNNVVLPSAISSICDRAFYGCSSLASVTIPNGVTSIGSYAFRGCSSLTIYCQAESKSEGWDTYWNASNRPVRWGTDVIKTESGLIYSLDADGSHATVLGLASPANASVIPTTLGGAEVVAIAEKAFEGISFITSIILPSSITTIGNSAFNGCSSLTIYCQSESKPEGWDANWNPSNRPVVWGINGFGAESGLVYSVDAGGMHATVLGLASPVTELSIPATLGGAEVVAIAERAFYGCSSPTSVTIPESVLSIGDTAFYGCSSLKTVTFESANPPSIGSDVFGSTWNATGFVIRVPSVGLEAYKAITAGYWQQYAVSHIVGY